MNLPPPVPFKIAVPQDALDDLRERLMNARLPELDFKLNDRWTYGMDPALLKTLLEHWREEYDWRKHEAELNALNHFKIPVQGINLHFIHQRSSVPGAVPLLLLHGWPGSVWEFHKMIPMLVAPEGRPLRLKQAFHVVAPSLPGFAWSDPAREPGMSARKMGHLFDELMRRLGYEHYATQGGDWGSIISRHIAHDFPERCVAMHLTMAHPLAPAQLGATPRALSLAAQMAIDLSPLGNLTMSERAASNLSRLVSYARTDMAYLYLQASRPNTIGFALTDTPVGLLAWICEKLHFWSDGAGNVLNVLSRDEIITNVAIYWLTNCAYSAGRVYLESIDLFSENPTLSQRDMGRMGYISVPTAIASFPREILMPPRSWVSHYFNVVHYTEHEVGGHFSAWERPEELAQDVRNFLFRTTSFEECVRRAEDRRAARKRREEAAKVVASSGEALPLKLLLLAPAVPLPVLVGCVAYLLSSKL